MSLVLLLLVGVFFAGCNANRLVQEETNYTYDKKIKELDPKFRVYHESESQSYLYLQLQTSNLLYVRENSSKPFECEVKVKYELYEDENGKMLLDSATKTLYDFKTSEFSKLITARIPFILPYGKTAFLKVSTFDINKKIRDTKIIEINKKDSLSDQFFLYRDQLSKELCFTRFFTTENEIEITSDYNRNRTFELAFFNTNYPASPPPFSANNKMLIADTKEGSTIFSFEGNNAIISLPNKGSYYIKELYSKEYPVILQKLDSSFDGLKNYQAMVEPMKYICTSKEYQALMTAENKRKAVEEFWVKAAGNKERARIVIEEYYSRVEQANKFFTSYKEGWKTDRGMLSIVMGVPNTVYKTKNGETWVYGTPHNMMMSLTFSFTYENEEKVKNDYQLIRYRTYRDYWYRACESWRQGRVYNFN